MIDPSLHTPDYQLLPLATSHLEVITENVMFVAHLEVLYSFLGAYDH